MRMKTDLFTGLSEAKNWVSENYKIGCICPCCNQLVKLYKRKLHSGMAITLCRIYKESTDWIAVEEFLRNNKYPSGHDWALLRYWNLIEDKEKNENEDEEKKCSGYWKITESGKLFVENKLRVKKYILVYNQTFYGYDGTDINVLDALSSKFNYSELMAEWIGGQN